MNIYIIHEHNFTSMRMEEMTHAQHAKKVLILPQHSCRLAEIKPWLYLKSGRRVQKTTIIEFWPLHANLLGFCGGNFSINVYFLSDLTHIGGESGFAREFVCKSFGVVWVLSDPQFLPVSSLRCPASCVNRAGGLGRCKLRAVLSLALSFVQFLFPCYHPTVNAFKAQSMHNLPEHVLSNTVGPHPHWSNMRHVTQRNGSCPICAHGIASPVALRSVWTILLLQWGFHIQICFASRVASAVDGACITKTGSSNHSTPWQLLLSMCSSAYPKVNALCSVSTFAFVLLC